MGLLQELFELVFCYGRTRLNHRIISEHEKGRQKTHQVQVVASEIIHSGEHVLIVCVGCELKIRLDGFTNKLVVAYEGLILWMRKKGLEICFIERVRRGYKQIRRDAQLDVHVECVDLETKQACSEDDER